MEMREFGQNGQDELEEVGRSFTDEVNELIGGLGWGLRWLGISLLWGLCLFAFITLIGYAIWGGPIAKPGPYYGLIVVTGLLAAIMA